VTLSAAGSSLATRHAPPPPDLLPDSVIEAPRGPHSEKPFCVHEMLERLYPEWEGARVEMFARKGRPGWTVWGAEAPWA